MAVYASCFHNLGLSLEALKRLRLAQNVYQLGLKLCMDYLPGDSLVT